MVKAHAARMYAMYNKDGYLVRDSIDYTIEDVQGWIDDEHGTIPAGAHILEITVTPHVPATPRKEEE